MRKDAVQLAHEWALEEIAKYGLPYRFAFETANAKGLELAKRLGADQAVVGVGTRLMDVKLGEAFKLGKAEAHVAMSVKATRDFLEKLEFGGEQKKKAIACVSEHHNAAGKFSSIESEICANADCYRFLDAKNFFNDLMEWGKRGETLKSAIELAEKKVREKIGTLSLPECKAELENDIKAIKAFIEAAKR